MWRIIKGFEISSCHMIKGHPKCGKLHGHNWQLAVKFKFNEKQFIDFADLKKLIADAIEVFDHTDLGNITCELLAKNIKSTIRKGFLKMFSFSVVELEDLEIELYETNKYGVIC